MPVADTDERVVRHGERDAFRRQPPGQPTVAIAIELQPERCPGGDAQIDQAQVRIHEIEVVVQTFAGVGTQEGLV